MSSSYSRDAQFLRDLENKKRQKVKDERNKEKQQTKDERTAEKIDRLDDKLHNLRTSKETEELNIQKAREYLQGQIQQVDKKELILRKRFADRKKKLIKKKKFLLSTIETKEVKEKILNKDSDDDSDVTFNLDLDSLSSESESESDSSSESEVTNQVIMPAVNPLEERKKLANARRQELREQGKPHIECIIWDEFPDVYKAEKEEEEKEEEAYKKSPEYLALKAEAEAEIEQAKQAKLEIQRQFREADQKVKTALQNIKEARLQKKSEHEIQGLKLVFQTAENEWDVLKAKYRFNM